tara:strand:- start:42 stop:2369 length:2328 start_codon:yes stop_codon:yes gene_type:complete
MAENYTHFVYDPNTGTVLSGWEFAEDAQDALEEINEMAPGKARAGTARAYNRQFGRMPTEADFLSGSVVDYFRSGRDRARLGPQDEFSLMYGGDEGFDVEKGFEKSRLGPQDEFSLMYGGDEGFDVEEGFEDLMRGLEPEESLDFEQRRALTQRESAALRDRDIAARRAAESDRMDRLKSRPDFERRQRLNRANAAMIAQEAEQFGRSSRGALDPAFGMSDAEYMRTINAELLEGATLGMDPETGDFRPVTSSGERQMIVGGSNIPERQMVVPGQNVAPRFKKSLTASERQFFNELVQSAEDAQKFSDAGLSLSRDGRSLLFTDRDRARQYIDDIFLAERKPLGPGGAAQYSSPKDLRASRREFFPPATMIDPDAFLFENVSPNEPFPPAPPRSIKEITEDPRYFERFNEDPRYSLNRSAGISQRLAEIDEQISGLSTNPDNIAILDNALPEDPEAGKLMRKLDELSKERDYLRSWKQQTDESSLARSIAGSRPASGGTEAAQGVLRGAAELEPDKVKMYIDRPVLQSTTGAVGFDPTIAPDPGSGRRRMPLSRKFLASAEQVRDILANPDIKAKIAPGKLSRLERFALKAGPLLHAAGNVALAAELGYFVGRERDLGGGLMAMGASNVEGTGALMQLPQAGVEAARSAFVPEELQDLPLPGEIATQGLAAAGRGLQGSMAPYRRMQDRNSRRDFFERQKAFYRELEPNLSEGQVRELAMRDVSGASTQEAIDALQNQVDDQEALASGFPAPLGMISRNIREYGTQNPFSEEEGR